MPAHSPSTLGRGMDHQPGQRALRRCRRRRGESDGVAATRCRRLPPARADRLEHAPALERREQPRRELRILGVDRQHVVDDEVVARAIGAVELLLVRQREGVDQGAHAIGIGEREGGMRGERLDAIERRRLRNGGLQR